jgi:hypothetical protein
MNFLSPIRKRRVVGLGGACALVLGGLASAAIAGAGAADAAIQGPPAETCSASVGNPCLIVGTANLSSGGLGTTVPGPLTWSGTLNGLGQNLYDSIPADEAYIVNNAGGSMTGWRVTLSATTFTSGTKTLPDSGTFSTNGSIQTPTSTDAPSQVCSAGPNACVLPNNSTTSYPVAVTTADSSPTPVSIYSAAVGTGIGSVTIGGSSRIYPVGWWLHVPGTAPPGAYTSNITINVISGP